MAYTLEPDRHTRWKLGLLTLALSLPFWFFSLLVNPYTSWGVEHEHLRDGVGEISALLAILALILVFAGALIVFWRPANRSGWKAVAFAIPLLFFGGTMIARLIWLYFWVL
jgi:hypothetical protein